MIRRALRVLPVLFLSVTALLTTGGAAQAATAPRWVGVTMPGLPQSTAGFSTLGTELGSTPGVAMWYVAWSLNGAFPAADAARVAAAGAVPEITWEPWDPGAGVSQPAYALSRIAAGDFDGYLRKWAKGVKAWGGPLRLRFAHEMNGTWYPWAEGVNGNAAGSYVAAWKHARAVFAGQGVRNVTWVWSPNVPYAGSTALPGLFPGDQDVDEVALDGYNWSTSQPGSSWTGFADIFAPGVAQLQALSARPVSIGEVGCPETGGDKAQWITGIWQTLAGWPAVRGVLWFDYDKEMDWRIDSSSAALQAFAAGIPGYLAG